LAPKLIGGAQALPEAAGAGRGLGLRRAIKDQPIVIEPVGAAEEGCVVLREDSIELRSESPSELSDVGRTSGSLRCFAVRELIGLDLIEERVKDRILRGLRERSSFASGLAVPCSSATP
jgi:hypothetical protein